MSTILVTPDSDFEGQVKRAFDGDFAAERCWDQMIAKLHPREAVKAIVDASQDPTVVVLGPKLATPAALALAEQFDILHPEICVVLVARATPRLWEQALRAGVREIIGEGADDEELRQSLTRAGAAAARRQATSATSPEPQAPRGRVITVMSPKGGAGKTTVATNLALRLAEAAPGKVAIIDLDLQFGDVASALALGPQSTIADAARAHSKLDSTSLKVFLEPHPGGLYALVGPHFPAEAEEVSATTVTHVLDILAAEFSYVVVDTGAGLDEYALAAVDRSDDLVLVCVTDVPSVRGLRKALDALDLLGMTSPRRHLVLNRSDDKVGLSHRDVSATLGLPIEASLATSRSVPISVNQGSPVVESDPRCATARALTDFAHSFTSTPAAASDGWFSRKDSR